MRITGEHSSPARDSRRVERLCRYMARPPLAVDRLEATSDGRLAYRLKTRWRDGTTHILMERHELLERLAPLIPPPRAHQVRYHGVLAPCASGRDRVVPSPARAFPPAVFPAKKDGDQGATASKGGVESRAPLGAQGHQSSLPTEESGRAIGAQADPGRAAVEGRESVGVSSTSAARRFSWAELLQRIFEVDALRCPSCGERMRIIAAITDPMIARRILKCLGLSPRAPPLSPPASPEPTADSWLTEPEAFDFDQTPPVEWDRGG